MLTSVAKTHSLTVELIVHLGLFSSVFIKFKREQDMLYFYEGGMGQKKLVFFIIFSKKIIVLSVESLCEGLHNVFSKSPYKDF